MLSVDCPGVLAWNVRVNTDPSPEIPFVPGGREAVTCRFRPCCHRDSPAPTVCPSCDSKVPLETFSSCRTRGLYMICKRHGEDILSAGQIHVHGEGGTYRLVESWRIEADDRASHRRRSRGRLMPAKLVQAILEAGPTAFPADPGYSSLPADYPAGPAAGALLGGGLLSRRSEIVLAVPTSMAFMLLGLMSCARTMCGYQDEDDLVVVDFLRFLGEEILEQAEWKPVRECPRAIWFGCSPECRPEC